MHYINGTCECPKCQNLLSANLALGGKFPGHYYLHVSYIYFENLN